MIFCFKILKYGILGGVAALLSFGSADMDVSAPTGTTVLGYWSDGPPWYTKDLQPSGLAVIDPSSKATPTPTPRETTPAANERDRGATNGSRSPVKSASRSLGQEKKVRDPAEERQTEPTTPQTLMPQRTEVVPKTPETARTGKPAERTTPPGVPVVNVQKPSGGPKITEKPEVDSDTEDLMGGYRLEDLPSPLGTIDGSNPTPPEHEEMQKTDVELPTPADLPLPGPPQNHSAVAGNGVTDHENTSVLSDPPDDDEDVDAEGSTEESEPAMDRMDVDDEDLDAEGEPDVDVEVSVGAVELEGGASKLEEGSPGSSSGGSGRKSRKGMVFARQSNGRFGSMKGAGGGAGGGRGRGRKKKW